MGPRRARDEEHRRERGHIDERSAEIRLDEDKKDRHRAEEQNLQRCPPLPDRRLPLGDQSCEPEDEKELPELRRLEAEEGEVDPACRTVRRLADGDDDQDEADDPAEQEPPVTAVEIRVDESGRDEHDPAHRCVEDLPVEVVVRSCRIMTRHASDPPEPDDDESREAGHEDPVERAHDGEETRRLALAPSRPL